ncbi:MAG: hypothetical protein R3E13_04285 [Alphaproteobacteria bacterium]
MNNSANKKTIPARSLPCKRQRTQENGNAFFYILIAVVLLAALSFAVSQNGRGNVQQISAERARLYAGEIIEQANIMASAVAQTRLRGSALNELCFDHTSWGASNYNHAGCASDLNKIYHPDGAGITWTNAPSEAMDTAATPDNLWHFYGDNEIENIGTTCGAASCADLIMLVDELQLTVCQQINGLLGVTDATATPPTDTSYGETRYIGSFGYTATIGDEAAALSGQTAACFQKTAAPAEYVFYKVLVSR